MDWDPAEGTECYVRGVGKKRWARHLINKELGVKVKEEARRLARQMAGGGNDKVGGSQEVREDDGVDLASDSGVVPGKAGVFEYGASIGGDPDGAKRGSGDIRGGGAKVMDGETGFIDH